MRKENGIILFETNKGQYEIVNGNSFEGILICKRPCIIGRCDVDMDI